MKIIGNGDLLGRIPTEKTALPSSPAVNGFGEILKQSLEQASAAGPSSAQTVSVQFKPAAPTPDSSVACRLEGFLDLLDGYCQKLSNPRVSLKGLESSVQELEERREGLSHMLGSLPEGDELKDTLNRALVTASLEIIRFRRGDYLPE